MKYLMIDGKQAAAYALGSADFGGSISETVSREIMDAYAALGGNYIDTAHVYGDFVTPKNGESEKIIGRWMEDHRSRDKIFLSTKGAHHVLGTRPVGRLSREELKRDLNESLEALRTDHIDIYWLHRDNPDYTVGEVMETLTGFVESGRVKRVGASNWSAARIREANAYAASHGLEPFYANQPQLSLAIQNGPDDPSLVQAEEDTFLLHAETGMLMTPFSSQAKGFLTKLDEGGEAALSDKAKRRFYTPENLAIYARTKQVSRKTGLSVGALALLWLTGQDFPVIPIVGARRPEQLCLLAEAADASLSREDVRYIRTIT